MTTEPRTSAPSAPGQCLNCGAPFGAPPPRFCPDCGQESNVRPPTLKEFAQQFGGAYIATEGALWRSLKLLLFKPGELTRQYLMGRRRHYVLPLRLYLTISVLVLLMLRMTGGMEVKVNLSPAEQGAGKALNISMLGDRAGLKDGVFYCKGLPPGICHRLKARLDQDAQGLAREAAEFGQRFLANLGAALFVLVPLYAALLKLAYWHRGMHYTEHLVCALHLHAVWLLLFALMKTHVDALAVAVLVATPVYTLLAFKRVYGGRWWPLLLSAVTLALVYLFAVGLALAVLAMWTILF